MKELENRQPGFETIAKGLVWTILAFVSREFFIPSDIPAKKGMSIANRQAMNKISTALEYISQNYMEPISIRQLAQMCSLSITHFRRLFTVSMGMAPLEYLTNLRIQIAAALLCHNNSSILAISQEVG